MKLHKRLSCFIAALLFVVAKSGFANEQQCLQSNAVPNSIKIQTSDSDSQCCPDAIKALCDEIDTTMADMEAFKARLADKSDGLKITQNSFDFYCRKMADLRRILSCAGNDACKFSHRHGLRPLRPNAAAPGPGPGTMPPGWGLPLWQEDDDFWFDQDMGFDGFFQDFQRIRDKMDQLLGRAASRKPGLKCYDFGGELALCVDVQDKGDRFVVCMDVPGMEKADFNLEIKDGALMVSGNLRQEQDDTSQGYVRRERRFGQFQRLIRLPEPVDAEKTQAVYENGVLMITLPKAGQKPAGKIVPVL